MAHQASIEAICAEQRANGSTKQKALTRWRRRKGFILPKKAAEQRTNCFDPLCFARNDNFTLPVPTSSSTFARVRTFPFLLGLLTLAALPACSSLESDKQQEDAAEKAVLNKHDEAMAQTTGPVYELRQKLQQQPSPDTVRTGQQVRNLLRAEAAMTGWMHQYRRPADSTDHERKLQYYALQQHKIDSVAVLISSSLDSARQVLAAGAAPTPSPAP